MGAHRRANGGELCIDPEGRIGMSGEKGHSEDPPDLVDGILWTDRLFVSLSSSKVSWETLEEIFSKAVASSPTVTLGK